MPRNIAATAAVAENDAGALICLHVVRKYGLGVLKPFGHCVARIRQAVEVARVLRMTDDSLDRASKRTRVAHINPRVFSASPKEKGEAASDEQRNR